MGCGVSEGPDGITVTGEKLTAIDTDMGDMPDMVPTLAVVAALAEGRTVMRNVAHLRAKESDRLAAMVTELNKTGISAGADKNTLVVEGGTPRGAVIDTYNDHRIAMSFAVLGHAVPGIRIRNEACVEKSFPTFWNVINEMGAS
jgi:3-phosphoshikimate 1-carboxyvinyltransferase